MDLISMSKMIEDFVKIFMGTHSLKDLYRVRTAVHRLMTEVDVLIEEHSDNQK